MAKIAKLRKLRGADIHRLDVFRVVVECGGLSAAAEFLGLDLSTVSRQVRDLEIRLGLDLCSRGPGGFALTAPGRITYDVACLLAETLSICDERLEGMRDGLTGTLRIGVVNHILSSPLLGFPTLVRIMRDKAPGLVIDCKVLTPDEIIRQIRSRQVHLGILGASPHPDEIISTPIFHESARLYCAEGHPLHADPRLIFDLEALEGLHYVARTHGSPSDQRAQLLGLVPATKSNDIDVISALVRSGLYLGFLPVHAVESFADHDSFRCLPLAPPEVTVPFLACTLRREKRSRRTDLFLQVVLDQCKRQLSLTSSG
ncbi:LysR family transcriptional regulator [Paracoccus sp. (in: a-proteobacteria)]|uniref:LysR family transcriptional regulator n=1 Tax=Paracoccus sp. TaxID=267 RepID=UPI0032206882